MNTSQLKKIAIDALNKAHQTHEELGVHGRQESVKKNQFGETALRVDIEAEEAVINTLREANLPIRIISEEHGEVDIVKNPIYLGVLDGIDGTRALKAKKGMYGTMFGIFSNLNPKYDDYLFSGVMEHSTKRLFYVSKGKKSLVITKGKTTPISCLNTSKLDKKIKIYIDEYWDFNKKTFSEKLQGFNTDCLNSSAHHYLSLISGQADLVLECTRKGNLEIAVAYGLVTKAGGVMETLDGVSLGQKKYLKFGQDKNIAVITASTKQLARELIEYINQN